MEFLIRNKGNKNPAHYWDGKDTFCEMFSSGGMKQSNYSIYDTSLNRDICHMCKINSEEISNDE